MSGNQILVKSASDINSHVIFFFSSSTKKLYSLSVNPVLGASVAMNKRFSKFICDKWFWSWVLTSISFEKNLLTHAVFRGKINIRWSSFKQLGKVIAQALFKHVEYNLCASKEVSEAWKVSLSFSFLQCISFIWNFSSTALPFFKHIVLKPRPLFSCSYTIIIPNLVYSDGFTHACFFFTVVID